MLKGQSDDKSVLWIFRARCKSRSVLGNFIKRHRVSVLAGLSTHGIEGIRIVDGSYNTDLYNFAFQHLFLNNVGLL